ncbi:MutS-like protein [Maribacter vaceletii]|uniref:MutS-like protein n=1 Tax=Maribacter vaceletii TaxID=1206816 RepID=A0A495EBD2_9FLAO|nr:DNA mismatch repair protein MutS [Maribacter vaceletii]RKR14198.1 MutS-like protein [Maribacter vaceletii]
MQELISFYTQEISKHQDKLARIKKQLFASSMLRLLIFCIAIAGLYFFYGNTKIIVGIILLTVVVFLYLVTRHGGLQKKRDKIKALIAINETEVEVQKRDFYNLPDGKEYKNPLHAYSQDIDLFGRGSFYQYCNRTALVHGSETLAGLFLENDINAIKEKQGAIEELSQMPKWRQEYSAIASMTKTETSVHVIEKWLGNYTPFMPKIMQYIPLVFSILSIGVFCFYFLDKLPESSLIIWLFVGLAITGIYTRKITRLGANASKVQNTFEQYNQLLTIIENTEFKSLLLQEKKKQIIAENIKTSKVLHEFSRHLGALDQNNNVVYLLFGNGFFLRGLATCFKIEKWIAVHGKAVEKWFQVIAFFDAYNSLGNFAFNHPKYTYPIIEDNSTTILKAKEAGHPLLNPESTILNNIDIQKEQFFIITGANMAGKSTFLRTVSLQIVMANLGLPVCAKEVYYSPIKLITSMRTTDSLTDDESYFFSELKRLKFIVDQIQLDRYFIVLDEILKGTNSTDKAIGSRKFIEKLVRSLSTGIIATHDLSLCEVSKELSQVKNYYFDAEIINNELHFDYKFKEGICKNMNASFLLKKMQIID